VPIARSAALLVAAALLAAATISAAGPTQRREDSARRAGPTVRAVIGDFPADAPGWRLGRGSLAKRRVLAGEPVLTLSSGALTESLPARSAISFDLRTTPGARVDLVLGSAGTIHLRETGGRLIGGPTTRLHRSAAPRGWYRVEATTTRRGVALDGQVVRTAPNRDPGHLRIQAARGSVDLRAELITPVDDKSLLLLHRLAWLHARTPQRKQPIGMGLDRRLRFSRSWTRGFWPGALWQAFDLTHNAMFERWARVATRGNFGAERADTHDLGFMYEQSSAQAYDHLCAARRQSRECGTYRRSAMTAANSLLRLAATNTAVGTIPTRAGTCTGCATAAESDTIVDSVMNLPLLYWATRVTGDPRYQAVAARHAHVVAADMVRADGSTWSSMHNRRSDGALIRFHTHQGYRDDSTWARGQAWAVYGFATAAAALRDASLLDTAERTTRFVMARLPTPAVSLYDYDAPRGAPHDVSAGVITAAGMYRLAAACEQLAATCNPAPADARRYARKLLAASLADTGTRPPLGFLGDQVYGLGGASSWDDDAELIFGVDYALEATNDERIPAPSQKSSASFSAARRAPSVSTGR
jgi:unsaturated chondroitin disaccharide hydrolase